MMHYRYLPAAKLKRCMLSQIIFSNASIDFG